MRADADDAIDNMTLIDSIYKAAGLPPRQPTRFFLPPGGRESRSLVPPGAKCQGKGAMGLK